MDMQLECQLEWCRLHGVLVDYYVISGERSVIEVNGIELFITFHDTLIASSDEATSSSSTVVILYIFHPFSPICEFMPCTKALSSSFLSIVFYKLLLVRYNAVQFFSISACNYLEHTMFLSRGHWKSQNSTRFNMSWDVSRITLSKDHKLICRTGLYS